jgi:hypothetical protein
MTLNQDDLKAIELIFKEEHQALATEIVRQLMPMLPGQSDGGEISLTEQMEVDGKLNRHSANIAGQRGQNDSHDRSNAEVSQRRSEGAPAARWQRQDCSYALRKQAGILQGLRMVDKAAAAVMTAMK